MTHLTRRAVLAGAATALAAPAVRAQGATELKLAHYLPPSHTVHKVLEAWGETLDRSSGGRLRLRIYPAGQLGPVPRHFDLARNGQADLAIGLTGATPGRYPMTELSNLPFVAPGGDSSSAATSKRLTELAPQYLAGEFAGLRILWFGVTPPNGFFTARREIRTLADLRGLKMRFQGEQAAKVLRVLGAVPLQVQPGEVTDGMAKGVIDGAIFNYEAGESFGIAPVTKYVTEPLFSAASLGLVMNPARYEALPAELRRLIDDTTGPAAAGKLGVQWDEANRHGREVLTAAKVTIDTLSAEEVARFKAAVEPITAEAVGELARAGKPAQAFLDAYRA